MEKTGVIIKSTRGDFHLRSTFGCLLGDVKGLQECLSLKGASGAKPCPFCRNVLKHPTYFHWHPYWCHVRSPDARFDLHTVDSFNELCTDLAAEVAAGTAQPRPRNGSGGEGLHVMANRWRGRASAVDGVAPARLA